MINKTRIYHGRTNRKKTREKKNIRLKNCSSTFPKRAFIPSRYDCRLFKPRRRLNTSGGGKTNKKKRWQKSAVAVTSQKGGGPPRRNEKQIVTNNTKEKWQLSSLGKVLSSLRCESKTAHKGELTFCVCRQQRT